VSTVYSSIKATCPDGLQSALESQDSRSTHVRSEFSYQSAASVEPGLGSLLPARLPIRRLHRGETIYAQGDPARFVYDLVSGWVGLHRDLPDGRRHMVKFLLAGALFGLEPKGVAEGQGATALTEITIRAMPLSHFDYLRQELPEFNERLLWILARDNHLASDALMIMSQGTAIERVAHVLWEVATRLSGPDAPSANLVFRIPLTQQLIANATGLTPIHVNRVIRTIRLRGIVELRRGIMIVRDAKKLAALAGASAELGVLWRARAPESSHAYSRGSAVGDQKNKGRAAPNLD
jgi:CRP-like cAMP-binding protein